MMLNLDSDNDDFDSKTEAFMTWLQQRPGATISPKIRIADLRHIGAGRGVGMLEIGFIQFMFCLISL